MTLLREIQTAAAGTDSDVTALLRKCKILASRLKSKDLARWVDWELNGYPDSQPVPDYRKLAGSCYANFLNRAWRANAQAVPWFLLPEEVRESHDQVEFRKGIATVASLGRCTRQ